MTKDTNRYLVTKILSPTYGMDGRTVIGALVLKFIRSYLWGGRITEDTDGYLSPKNLLSSTYRGDESLWIPTGA